MTVALRTHVLPHPEPITRCSGCGAHVHAAHPACSTCGKPNPIHRNTTPKENDR